MTHAEMDELYELYALGVLEAEFAAMIDSHLAENCEHCELHLRQARALNAALAGVAPSHPLPPALRERVLYSVGGKKPEPVMLPAPTARYQGSLYGWIAALAASLIACLYLGVQNRQLNTKAETTSAQLASANRDRAALETALKDLSRSETRTVEFGRADQPHGRLFVTRDRGVVFVASSLPSLQSGLTFQLWLVPNSGAPRSGGLFRADNQGLSVRVTDQLVDSQTKAVAVSIEPASGSSSPTTAPIIVVPVGG